MTHSLLDRQLATITNILREREQGGANQHAKVTPARCNEGSGNAASVTAKAVCKDSASTSSVSRSEGMHAKQLALPSSRDAEDMDDPRRMLRVLERDAQERHAKNQHTEFHNSKRADMSKSVETTSQHSAVGDSPKEMLQDLNHRCWAAKALDTVHNETSSLTGSKAMLTDLKKEKQALGLDAYQSTESDPETAFERSTTAHSPFHSLAPQHTVRTSEPVPASYAATTTCRHSGPPIVDALDPETIPYVVALMLEVAGCKWEEVVGWTRYLFSSGMDEYRAKKEREQKAQEKETFDAIVARFLVDEEKRRAVEKKPFANRVILSNLAADVDLEAIYQFFSKYQKDIRDITLLPERDPVKRTRTAYMDMSSRTAAVRASFEFGYIYGLRVKGKLAVSE